MRSPEWTIRMRGLDLLSPALILLVIAFLAPIIVLLPTSLHTYLPGVGIGSDYSVANYVKFVTDDYYLEIIGRTFLLGLMVTLLTLVSGYPVAYFLARSTSRWRPWVTLLIVFPLLLNLVVRTFGWITLLANNGLINDFLRWLGIIDTPLKLMFNFTGLLIGLTHIYLPFMILILIPAIEAIPSDLEDASRTLGSNRWSTFRHVVIPMSAPGILSGSILVFVLTISALVTPRLLGGPTYQVVATLIYDQFLQLLDWPAGAAMSWLLTVMVIALIAISSRIARRWGAQ